MATRGPRSDGARPARRWAVVRILLLAALIDWPGAGGSQAPQPRQLTEEIGWSRDWLPTDFIVEEGDTLSIAIRLKPPADDTPDGDRRQEIEKSLATMGGLDKFVGRIGEGPAFPIPSGFRQVMTTAGNVSLRWNVPPEWAGIGARFTVDMRAERERIEDPDPDLNLIVTNATGDNASVDSLSIETASPPRQAPRRADRPAPIATPVPPPAGREAIPWLVGGLVVVLLAGAAAVAAQRSVRARRVERTRAMLGVSPSLDLAEGSCRGDDLPAEGPSASLRARLEPGAAHMEEGSEHG